MVTGGSHNSSGFILSNVSISASGSPGEQASQTSRGPLGFGFCTYVKVIKLDNRQNKSNKTDSFKMCC